jgi:putative transcriptional regulator
MAHKTVGNKIKELRTNLGLTQAQLAELVGVARVSIVSIETGRFIPTMETALRISKALGVPTDQIFWLKADTK